MPISPMDFIRIKEVFKGLSIEDIQYFLDASYRHTTIDEWDNDQELFNQAIIEYTAHSLRIERDDHFRQSASVKTLTENEEIKIPFLDLKRPYLDQTIYGQRYKMLRQNLNGGSSSIV